MKLYIHKNNMFLPALRRAALFALTLALFFCLALTSACQKEVDYFSYVSELRSNIFRAEEDGLSLRIFAVEKEYPYASDGVKRDTSTRTEVYLVAPNGEKTYTLSFLVDGVEYGGEMSYDNVKAQYYYSCTLDVSALSQIDCTLTFESESVTLCARSVKTENTLTPRAALESVLQAERETFDLLTDEYGFAGEIYIRLIYEDFPYYYVGVTDRNQNSTAFLLNGETGSVLAKR